MFGLLLGGLLGRAAAGGAARVAARPLLSGLMSRRGGGGAAGGQGVSGVSSPGASESPTTVKQPQQEQPLPQPAQQQAQQQEQQQAPRPPEPPPMAQEVSTELKQQPTLATQEAQPSNPTTPIKPLEGLLDNEASPSPPPPRPIEGTNVDAPQPVVSLAADTPPTTTPEGDTFPNAPPIGPTFLADKNSQLPPRTFFVAPDGNPSKAIDTSTKVNNSSPGYATVGMSSPASAAPSFSYLRR